MWSGKLKDVEMEQLKEVIVVGELVDKWAHQMVLPLVELSEEKTENCMVDLKVQ